jgi:hypothetical protein
MQVQAAKKAKPAAHSERAAPAATLTVTPIPTSEVYLQRQSCACGGDCPRCQRTSEPPTPPPQATHSLQADLAVGATDDPLEREADSVADQVMTTSTPHAIGGAPPRIQRFAGRPTGQLDAAPASVAQAIASPGRPLEPVLRQDMEQRFGYDFSRVQVHAGAVADQSAREVNARAYTVGQNMVFAAGRFAPGTHEGRRLLAHELTHVVQQRSVPTVQRAPEDGPAIGCKPWPTEPPMHGKTGLKPSGRDVAIEYSLAVTPGHFCETPRKSVALLQYERTVRIRTASGHEAILRLNGDTAFFPPFDPKKSDFERLRAPGYVSLRWEVEVKYSKDILSREGFDIAAELTHWHTPRDGADRVVAHNQSLAGLAKRQQPFLWFFLSPRQQQQALEDFVNQSAQAEIPALRKRFEEWKKKHPPQEKKRHSEPPPTQRRTPDLPVSQKDLDDMVKNADQALALTADVVTDFIPYVSTAKFVTIATTGINPITGQRVGFWGRLLAGIFALISLVPGASAVVKLLGRGLRFLASPLVWLGAKLAPLWTRASGWAAEQFGKFINWLRRRGGASRPALQQGTQRSARFQAYMSELRTEMPALANIVDEPALERVLHNLGDDAVDNILLAAEAQAAGGAAAARLANEYIRMADQMSHIRNIETLFESIGKGYGAVVARRGADYELMWVWHHRADVAAVAVPRATTAGVKQGADVVMRNGRVMELKDYTLTSGYYAANAQRTAEELAHQAGLRLQEGYGSVTFVFGSGAAAMPPALASALTTELGNLARSRGVPPSALTFDFWIP